MPRLFSSSCAKVFGSSAKSTCAGCGCAHTPADLVGKVASDRAMWLCMADTVVSRNKKRGQFDSPDRGESIIGSSINTRVVCQISVQDVNDQP